MSFRQVQEQCTHTALTVALLTKRHRCSILDTMAAVSPFTASPSSQSLFPRKKRTFYKITSTNLHLFCLSLGVKNRYIQWKPADYIQPFTVTSIRTVSPKTLPVAFSQITLPTVSVVQSKQYKVCLNVCVKLHKPKGLDRCF